MNNARVDISSQLGEIQSQRGELYLAGSGSFAVEVAEWAQDAGWKLAGFVELLDASRVGSMLGGYPIVEPTSPPSKAYAVVALGGDRRKHWETLGTHGWRAATVVHPRAHVSRSAKLGEGCILAPGAVIGAATIIDRHTLVSRGALVGHHARIGAYASLMPGVNLGGHVELGDRATIGMGAVIVNGTRVGADAAVAAGAVVLKEVADKVRVQGVPAKEYRG
jgi:sugar O-acyltransferase (sialic acid O-acetyltransferase NeuD family)